MATASFRKDLPPQLSPDHDGADPRAKDVSGDPVDTYQMVPVGGTRSFSIRTAGQVRIEVFSTLGAQVSIDGAPAAKFQTFNSPAETVRTFTIHGRGEGRTTIFALDETRTILDRMMVSVKKERVLTYNLHRLGDSLRETPRTMQTLRSILADVEKTYLQQANVRLVRRRENEMLRIKKNLRDPIDVSIPFVPALATRPNFRVVLKERLDELGFLGEDLNLVSSWRLTGADGSLGGFTPDLGRICVCEAKNDHAAEASTYAHEMGHALGLFHGGHSPVDLMNGIGQDSFRMIQPDIDKVNPSGTSGLPQK